MFSSEKDRETWQNFPINLIWFKSPVCFDLIWLPGGGWLVRGLFSPFNLDSQQQEQRPNDTAFQNFKIRISEQRKGLMIQFLATLHPCESVGKS